MARNGAPAKPWHEEVVMAIAVRGWTKAELSDRSGVARTTIDNWERNPRKPQAKSVNAVADALGIPRERALRLAGIIPGTAPGPPAAGAAVPPELAGRPALVQEVRSVYPDPEKQALMMEAIARWLRGEPPPREPGAGDQSPSADGEEAG